MRMISYLSSRPAETGRYECVVGVAGRTSKTAVSSLDLYFNYPVAPATLNGKNEG